jgi:hypothetical protein
MPADAAIPARLTPSTLRHAARVAAFGALAFAAASALAGCPAPAKAPPVAGPAGELRANAPLPACVTALGGPSPKGGEPGGMARSLREDELWATVFPGFSAWRVPAFAPACTGERIALGAGQPLEVTEGSTLFGGGADRLRVAWLPVLAAGDRATGALALYRSRGALAEVLGVAPLDAVRGRTKLGIERLGADVIVVVTDEGCAKKLPGADCETRVTLFAPRRGRLVTLTAYSVEKIAHVAGGEPGVQGVVAYHLEASARFEKTSIRISELLRVQNVAGVELRRIQQERAYAPSGEGLAADRDALVAGPPRP